MPTAILASRATADPMNIRSVEQPVNLDDGDDVYNWPWLYAVQTGRWNLTDSQARSFATYLLRGGFFMCDDFWVTGTGTFSMPACKRVFPDRAIVELADDASIFHTVFDLDDRYQVPGHALSSDRRDLEMPGLPGAVARNLRR